MPTAAEYDANKRKTEAELRARLGAEPDAEPSDASTRTQLVYVPRNPYIVTLVVLTCLCAVVAFVCFIASISIVDSSGSPDPLSRAAAAGFGTDWLAFAFLFFIPLLILGSLKWKAPRSK
ncbi:MAG TPA: hypothetical protein VHX87_11170 [Galbitalea sp.]|nr:hypothetical protein [Galbitalea sp.]